MLKPSEVPQHAKRKEDENIRFRTYLKCHADETTLDAQFLRLHNELFADYDCSQCRNCCKLYHGFIPKEELEQAAAGLNLTREQLIADYLNPDEFTGDYETKHMPCDFLTSDGSCLLGDARPENCREYPYTNAPDRLASLYGVLEAVEVCPVAYEIWERLKQEYGFRTGRRR